MVHPIMRPQPEPEIVNYPACREVMIDIETLGKKRGCAILTIGAVAFDYEHDDFGESFYCHVLPQTNVQAGLDVDIDTVLWWTQQSQQAQQSLTSKSAIPLKDALENFTDFLKRCRERARPNKLSLWSNDPEFDAQILEGGYEAVNLTTPWNFWENRSMRTIVDLGQRFSGRIFKKEFPRQGVYHDALDDAKYQTKLVKAAYQTLGVTV